MQTNMKQHETEEDNYFAIIKYRFFDLKQKLVKCM